MFSVWRVLVDRVFTPKNGPVPERRVNGYAEIMAKKKAGRKDGLSPSCPPHERRIDSFAKDGPKRHR